MNPVRLSFACLALFASGHLAHAQMTSGDARADGEAMARSLRDGTNSAILSAGSEASVPGFGGTDIPARRYVDDPKGLTTAGEAHQEQYASVTDVIRTAARIQADRQLRADRIQAACIFGLGVIFSF